MPGYGNWCGPNWTAGQSKPANQVTSEDRNVPAVDGLDQLCKEHDIALADHPENAKAINQHFISQAKNKGLTGKLFALAVAGFGPSPAMSSKTPTMIEKRKKREDDFESPYYKARRVGHNTISPGQGTMVRRNPFIEANTDVEGTLRYPPGARRPLALPAPGDDDEPMPEAGQLAQRSGATSSTRKGIHGETPTDGYAFAKKTPWPDTDTIKHSYYQFLPAQSLTAGVVGTQVITRSFRLNSIYDVEDNSAYSSAQPTLGASDVQDGAGSRQLATWRNHYAGYYNYWSVLNSTYRIRILIYPTAGGSQTTAREIQLMCYVYHHGAQKPPVPQDTNMVSDFQFRKDHDGMYYFPISYRPEAGFNLLDQMNEQTASGTWSPGSIEHEVAEDENKQIWHKVDEVPPTREGLTIMILPAPNNQYTANIDIRMDVTIDYTTQWKDLKTQYQYLLPGVDQQTTADSAQQTTV